MRQPDSRKNQRGVAAIEMAVGMLLLVPLFLVLVEGTGALRQYSELQNAAMEGARMLVRQGGDSTNVVTYVQNLLAGTDCSAPVVTISDRDANNNVTVQVNHAFTPFFVPQDSTSNGNNAYGLEGTQDLTLSASVTMALAEEN
ncbi:MAG: TadE/TadG family type IV pilus assembly protein [Desulfovibrionaceae bacterium]|jgi:Flp pilus assembly protein TadG